MTDPDVFTEIQTLLVQDHLDDALGELAERWRARRQWHLYFDLQLIRHRRKLGLSAVLALPLDELPEPERSELEKRTLETCHEVGHGLLAEGRLREAWAFLRPLGDPAPLARAIEQTEVHPENAAELIELALYQGIAPARGFQLILHNQGVCNAITAFDSHIRGLSPALQEQAASLLVRRVHADLVRQVRSDVEQRTGQDVSELGLVSLTRDWPQIFEQRNYHLDTTHLHSCVRIARVVHDREVLQLAWELTQYGCALDRQYQFEGEEPFVDVYSSHGRYFGALLGMGVDEAVSYFRKRAQSVDAYYQGTMAAEIYVDLLARLGRWHEALNARLSLIAPDIQTQGIAPSLWELCRNAGDFGALLQLSREKGDVVGFLAGVLGSRGVT